MTVAQALSNPTIRRVMRDLLSRRMVGTYAGQDDIETARILIRLGYR